MDQNNHEFVGEAETEENFEELLNQSMGEPVYLRPGEKIEAVITGITKEHIFINFGGKTEGYIALNEFLDDEGNKTINEGDTIAAFFLSSRNNEMLFTTRLGRDVSGQEHLSEAYHNQIPIEGLIEKETKGGYEVKISGNVRAFCPFSQMGFQRVDNADQYIGQHVTFEIIEFGENGRNIVLSNRRILEKEQRKQRDLLKETLKEGTTVTGEIVSIRDFGAFVNIGGIEGLIPISEISWGHVDDINGLLSVGEKVDVAIKELDWENNKFSFSLKEVLPDPWKTIRQKYPEGSVQKGKVARLVKFGAFVTLEPGIDGLIHISELGKGKRINHPSDVLQDNQAIEVKIGKVDEKGKRLSLSWVLDDQGSEDGDDYQKYMSNENKKRSGDFGTLGDLLREKLGQK